MFYAGLAACKVLVAAAAQAQEVSFEAARSFTAGLLPHAVAVGDFNGDGVPDLAGVLLSLPVRLGAYQQHAAIVLPG